MEGTPARSAEMFSSDLGLQSLLLPGGGGSPLPHPPHQEGSEGAVTPPGSPIDAPTPSVTGNQDTRMEKERLPGLGPLPAPVQNPLSKLLSARPHRGWCRYLQLMLVRLPCASTALCPPQGCTTWPCPHPTDTGPGPFRTECSLKGNPAPATLSLGLGMVWHCYH